MEKDLDNKKMICNILCIFMLSKIILLGVYILATTLYPEGVRMNAWDSLWYLSIVNEGYATAPTVGGIIGGQANWAFFPLYPGTVRIIKNIFNISAGTAGIIVSNVCTILLAYMGVKYIKITRYKEISTQMFLGLLFMGPYAIYLNVTYTEAMFMLLTICSLYNMKKEKWITAGIYAMLASATRVTGVILLIPLLFNMYNSISGKLNIEEIKRFVIKIILEPKMILACMLVPGGIFAYMYYLYFKVGDAFAFKNVQIGWGRENNLIEAINRLVKGLLGMDGTRQLYLSWTTIAIVIILIYLFINHRYDEALYGMVILAIPLLSSLDSTPRYGFGTVVVLLGINDIYEKYLKNNAIVMPVIIAWGIITTLLWFSGNNVMI